MHVCVLNLIYNHNNWFEHVRVYVRGTSTLHLVRNCRSSQPQVLPPSSVDSTVNVPSVPVDLQLSTLAPPWWPSLHIVSCFISCQMETCQESYWEWGTLITLIIFNLDSWQLTTWYTANTVVAISVWSSLLHSIVFPALVGWQFWFNFRLRIRASTEFIVTNLTAVSRTWPLCNVRLSVYPCPLL